MYIFGSGREQTNKKSRFFSVWLMYLYRIRHPFFFCGAIVCLPQAMGVGVGGTRKPKYPPSHSNHLYGLPLRMTANITFYQNFYKIFSLAVVLVINLIHLSDKDNPTQNANEKCNGQYAQSS